MIWRLFSLMLLLLPGVAQAEVARVSSGEHADFSRLVITLDEPSAWQFGRTADGYALSFSRDGITFDTEAIFGRIPKTRIGAVRQGAVGSRLQVLANCECHATVFEFRPGIIVIDVKNGPPDKASPFEKPAEAAATSLPAPTPVSAATPVGGLVGEDVLQQQLLRELSLGAARGVVEMEISTEATEVRDANAALSSAPGIGLGISSDPGIALRQGGAEEGPPEREGCISDSRLAIQDWGGEGDPMHQLAEARRQLAGETDRPRDPEVVAAAQMLIHLGFGAEARQLAQSLAPGHPDRPLLVALGHLVDGGADPSGHFAGMEACDTAAALWSILGRSQLRPAEQIGAAAVIRAFSALPLHLRQHLSVPLAQRFLQQGDTESARRISNSLTWSVGAEDAAVRFIAATLEDGRRAEALGDIAETDPLRGPEALIGFVEASYEQRNTISAEMITEIAAVAHSWQADGARSGPMRRALALAHALGGDFDQALGLAAGHAETVPDIWALLAESGPDSALLHHAVLGTDKPMPDVRENTGLLLASRLAGLGLRAQAGRWLDHIFPPGRPETLEVGRQRAELALQDQDLPAAITTLERLGGAEAEVLRARVETEAGRHAEAAALFEAAGMKAEARRAHRLARQWQGVQAGDEGAWQSAALLLRPSAAEGVTNPSLELSRQLMEESRGARATLGVLLEVTRVDGTTED